MQRETLPTNVIPTNYQLTLTPDLEKSTFTGTVVISLVVKEPTSQIVLNSKEISILATTLNMNDTVLHASNITYNKENDWTTLDFAEEVPTGEASLTLDYEGVITDKMCGLYQCKYSDGFVGAATQFEAVDARRALPCWDEPALKATFDVSLVVPSELLTLSNMPEVETEHDETQSLKKVTFQQTPVMSTYLLAFYVGKSDCVEDTAKIGGRDVPVRVYTPVGEKEKGTFALSVAVKTLQFFSEYFEMDYPLPKMDMIALPDFAMGAMENWGLVTYRDTCLLCDPEKASVKSKTRVAEVVCHELAHQWFGNLVTMEWWTDLWLNEGFATWVGTMSVDHFFPDWNVWDQSLVHEHNYALELDCLANSHPIEVPINKASEVDEIFDTISYLKGCSVIGMLVDYLGQEEFRQGISHYLKRHQYANTVTNDLWTALSETTGKPVAEFMSNWTQKKGYPVVTVKREDDHLVFTQGTYNMSNEDTVWFVSLNLLTPDGMEHVTFNTKMYEHPCPNWNNKYWVKVNHQQTGFYRVVYSEELKSRLYHAILGKKLSVRDKIGLINDDYSLMKRGYLDSEGGSTCLFLNSLLPFVDEKNYTVWNELIGCLASVRSVWYLEEPAVQDRLVELSLAVIEGIAKEVDWDVSEDDDYSTSQLRSLVLGTAGNLGHPEVLAEGQARFKRFMEGDTDAVHPDLRRAVFSMVVKYGGETEMDQLMNLYPTSDPTEKRHILFSLGNTQDAELVMKLLDFAFKEDSPVRNQDTYMVFYSIANNLKMRDTAWCFLKENWDAIYKKFSDVSHMIGSFIEYTVSVFTTEDRLEEVTEFMEQHKEEIKSYKMTVGQSLEKVRMRMEWFKRDKAQLAEMLLSNEST